MLAPGIVRNAVAVGIGSDQHHRAMATNLATTCLLLGFALLCGLQNIEGLPSVDPPMPYPGLRRSSEPMSAESDEMMDDAQGPPSPPAPPVSPVGPSLNPLFPLIARMKPGKLGPVDPSQFIKMKAELLKNLLGPGAAKSPVARTVSSKGSKWAGAGATWGGPAAAMAAGKWGVSKPKDGKPAANPAPATNPQPSPWDWPPSAMVAPAAPAAPAPQAPVAPQAPASWAPAPAPAPVAPVSGFPSVPGYWIPSSILPVPADPNDKKAALVEALLDNLLGPMNTQPMMQGSPMPASPMRLARAPSGPSPALSELLDSLNLTMPAAPLTLKPTIEPPGFWFPSYVPAAPGSLTPFVVDPSAQIAKKTKFLSDLFASKAAAAAATAAASSKPGLRSITRSITREVNPAEYTEKVSTYIDSLLDSTTSTSKRASGIAPKKTKPTPKPMKGTMKGTKQASKMQMVAMSPAAAPMNPPVMEETPEDEMALDLMLGLRKKREIEDETEADIPEDDVTAKSAAILNDMATVKQNILVQLDAMNKAEMAASKAVKLTAKANKKASTLAILLGVPVPTSPPVPTAPVTDFQQKIAVLTNIYSQLSDTQKNLTSAPDANDPLNPDKLFIAAVNARVNKILLRNALLPTAPVAPKVARSNNWQRWRGQQDNDAASQYEGDNETSRRQKSAVPLVAAVFAPQTTHYMSRQPNW